MAQVYFLTKILPYEYIDSVLIDYSYNHFTINDLTVRECNILKKILLKLSENQRKLMFTKASLKIMGIKHARKTHALTLTKLLYKYDSIKDMELDFKGKTFSNLIAIIENDIQMINNFNY